MSAVIERRSTDWLNRRTYPFTPNFLEVSGGRMHFVDEGEGEPILFLHGCPTWSYLFRNVIKQLSANGYRCIAPDHIGYGLSDKPTAWSHTPAAHSQNVARLIDHLGLSAFTLVGHHLGGPIGLAYAVEYPTRVSKIVLANTWMGCLDKDPGAQKIANMANGPLGKFLYLNTGAGTKSIRSHFVSRENYTDEIDSAYKGPFMEKEHRISTFEAAKNLTGSKGWHNEIWSGRQALVGKPMLLLWGLKDAVFGDRMLNRIWHEFPLADVATYPDHGSYMIEENPREVVRTLSGFVTAPVKSRGFVA